MEPDIEGKENLRGLFARANDFIIERFCSPAL